MPVYMVIEIEVLDEGLYSEYVERVPSVIKKYGGSIWLGAAESLHYPGVGDLGGSSS